MRILIVFFCILSMNTYALITNENTPARILKIRSNNLIILNRGLEDGIEPNDHGKITNPNTGFVARAICLKATKMTSFWKVYRVVYPNKVSLDDEYILTSINDSEIPSMMEEFSDQRFNRMYVEDNEKVFIAKQKEEEERYQAMIERRRKIQQGGEDSDEEIEEDSSQLENDFRKWHLTFGIDPFNLSRTKDFSRERTLGYSLNLSNRGETYNVELILQQNDTKNEVVDESSEERTMLVNRTRSDSANLNIEKRNFIPRFSLTSNFSLSREYSDNFMLSQNVNVSPLGITASVIKVDPTDPYSQDHWSLSLQPSYIKITTNQKEEGEDAFGDLVFTGNVITENVYVYNLTLVSRIQFNLGIVGIDMNTNWGPNFSPGKDASFNTRNVSIDNTLSLQFPFSRTTSFALTHQYRYNAIPQFGIMLDQKYDHIIMAQFRFNMSFSNQ